MPAISGAALRPVIVSQHETRGLEFLDAALNRNDRKRASSWDIRLRG
jgi:hypothetical protein